MARYYVDTNIWIDYYENRKDNFRPLGEWAFEFFKKVNENEDLILYSDSVIFELEEFYSSEKIVEMMSLVTKIVKISPSDNQIMEAERLKLRLKIPFFDALHAVLTRDNNAILVSRDRHFDILRIIVDTKKPEEII